MQYEFDLNVKLKQLELQAQKELVELAQSETQKETSLTQKLVLSKISCDSPDTGIIQQKIL